MPSSAEKSFDCGDGPRHKIDVSDFALKYSGNSFDVALQVLSRLKLTGTVEDKTLQTATEATQKWNQFLIGLAEGFNSCAITKKQYNEALLSIYPRMKANAEKILNISKAHEKGQKADLGEVKRLMDEYLEKLKKFAHISGKEEIITTISDKIETEHKKTRELIAEQGKKIDEQGKQISKMYEIITQNKSIPKAKEDDIIRSTKQVEKDIGKDLKNKYDLGYALLYVDKESWYYVPINVELSVNWFSTKIIALSKDQITILLPDFIDKNQNRFTSNTVTLPLVPGASISPFRIGSISLVAEFLDASEKGIAVVIGFQTVKS